MTWPWREASYFPCLPPAGWHWRPFKALFIGGIGWALIENGRDIDELGFYEPRPKGNDVPMPTWTTYVQFERQTRRETERLLTRKRESERQAAKLDRLRQQYRA